MASRGIVAEENNNISSRGIRKKGKNSVLVALKRYKIDGYNLLDLDTVLRDVYCFFQSVSADYNTRKELLRNLNDMALDMYGNSRENSPVLEVYGSFGMDLFTLQSDLDLSIDFGNEISELPRKKVKNSEYLVIKVKRHIQITMQGKHIHHGRPIRLKDWAALFF